MLWTRATSVVVDEADDVGEDRSHNIVSILAIRRALEAAGVEFIEENGGGPGVRLKKGTRPKSITSSNLLACTTGKSAGLAPLRMRPT